MQHQAGRDPNLYLDFQVSARVMTKEAFPGSIVDIHEGPGPRATSYCVLLANGMGEGEWAESDLTPLVQRAASSSVAVGEHTAADDYPELGTILIDRPPLAHSIPAEDYLGGKTGSLLPIVEVNGAGAESTHIWDRRTGLLEAWRDLMRQYRCLFQIGAANRARGFSPMPWRDTSG